MSLHNDDCSRITKNNIYTIRFLWSYVSINFNKYLYNRYENSVDGIEKNIYM